MANDQAEASVGDKTPAPAKAKAGRPKGKATKAAADFTADLAATVAAQGRQIQELLAQLAAAQKPAPSALVPMSELDLGPDGGLVRNGEGLRHAEGHLIFDPNRPSGKR